MCAPWISNGPDSSSASTWVCNSDEAGAGGAAEFLRVRQSDKHGGHEEQAL